jgi:hypothetical protein
MGPPSSMRLLPSGAGARDCQPGRRRRSCGFSSSAAAPCCSSLSEDADPRWLSASTFDDPSSRAAVRSSCDSRVQGRDRPGRPRFSSERKRWSVAIPRPAGANPKSARRPTPTPDDYGAPMPVNPEDLAPFENRQGPVHVVQQDGAAVAYGASARLQFRDADRPSTWSVEHVELALLDEQSVITRLIPGDSICQVRPDGPGFTVVVDEDVEPDPGPSLRTRGT